MNYIPTSTRRKALSFPKLSKKFIIGFLLIFLIVTSLLLYFFVFKSSASASKNQRTQTVHRGNLAVSVTGSASITTSNQEDITSEVQGTLKKVNFEQGEKVKAGDVMFEIDDTEASISLAQVENDYKQQKSTISDLNNTLNSLSVKAPFSGVVKEILAKAGDSVSRGTNILTLVDESKLKLTVSFSDKNRKYIKNGQSATIVLSAQTNSSTSSRTSTTTATGSSDTSETATSDTASSTTVKGYVSYISNVSYTTSSGNEVYNVEITINNSGSITEGKSGTVSIKTAKGTSESTNSGTLSYINKSSIKSTSDAEIISLNVRDGQKVSKGAVLYKLDGNSIRTSLENENLKLESLDLELKNAQEKMQSYVIKASIDGTIISQTVQKGDSVSQGTILSSISNNNGAELEISIDELDIEKVKVGQEAEITVDALTKTQTTPLTGKVIEISDIGSSNSGVTTYPVTIKINESDDLKVGMNADAEIFIEKKSDVLLIPIEAVTKMGERSFVWIPANVDNQQNNNIQNSRGSNGNFPRDNLRMQQNSTYYVNAQRLQIETGIYNAQYIEVVSGLNEGDTIILPELVSSSSSTQQQVSSPFGGSGGFMMRGDRTNRQQNPQSQDNNNQPQNNNTNNQNSTNTNNSNGTGNNQTQQNSSQNNERSNFAR